MVSLLLAGSISGALLLLARSAISVAYARKMIGDGIGEGSGRAKLICLLPAFKEQDLVDGTLRTFADLAAEVPEVRIVVVTSLREERAREALRSETGGLRQATTTEVVRNWLSRTPSDPFLHLVFDGEGGGKSQHLNFALSYLRGSGMLDDRCYVGIFDFDSRPEPGSLDAIARAASSAASDAIIQPVLPILNAGVASAGGIADSALHVLRGFAAEAWIWSIWRLEKLRPVLTCLFDYYFVGAGLFIRSDRLRGDFPVPVDDIPLGFRAAREKWRVTVVNKVCLTQAYPDVNAAIRSRAHVFRAYLDAMGASISRPGWVLSGSFREAVVWLLAPLIVVFFGLALALYGAWISLGVSVLINILAVAIAVSTGTRLARRFDSKYPKVRPSILGLSIFYSAWRCLSAWRCVRDALFGHANVVDAKTPRIVG